MNPIPSTHSTSASSPGAQPVYPEFFTLTGKRFIVCRMADYFGAIPIVGAVVGIGRAIFSGIALGGAVFMNDGEEKKNFKDKYIAEAKRGFYELVSGGTLFWFELKVNLKNSAYFFALASLNLSYGTYIHREREGGASTSRQGGGLVFSTKNNQELKPAFGSTGQRYCGAWYFLENLVPAVRAPNSWGSDWYISHEEYKRCLECVPLRGSVLNPNSGTVRGSIRFPLPITTPVYPDPFSHNDPRDFVFQNKQLD